MDNPEIMALYTNHPYRWKMVQDAYNEGEPCYVASYPDLPGCMAQGDTPEEALRSLIGLRDFYIDSMKKRGLPVPDPQVAAQASAPQQSAAVAQRSQLSLTLPRRILHLDTDKGEATATEVYCAA
jgi:predicted RNase H-like HicB family nuclease